MSNYTIVFKQILSLIPRSKFEEEVRNGGYNLYVKHFTAWNQLKVNLYAQISGKKSLRDIETGLQVQSQEIITSLRVEK